jgi:hypothetical protein
MHWAPIPIAEFDLPPPVGRDLTNEDVFRLLSRAPRRGFWLSAVGFILLVAIGMVAIEIGYPLGAVLCFVIAWGAVTGNLLIRHRINAALWVSREPAAVYWAAPRQWVHTTDYVLTLHTPAAVQLEAILTQDELIGVLHWLRQRNPDALIGSYSPSDSDGRLSGNDPWSPQTPQGVSANPIHTPIPYRQPVRGFFFWSLSPFLAAFIILMPLLVQKRDTGALITLVVVELVAVLALLGLFSSCQFWWAWRGVGAIIFLGYCAYLVAMLVESGGKIAITPRKSEASAFNAICGLIVFGVPGLCYAVFGRLTLRGESAADQDGSAVDREA